MACTFHVTEEPGGINIDKAARLYFIFAARMHHFKLDWIALPFTFKFTAMITALTLKKSSNVNQCNET